MIPGLTIRNLRVEYRVDPLGIDNPKPRLTWLAESEVRGQKQTAYRILAASRPEALAAGQADLWDSGKIKSGSPNQVIYAGKTPESRERVWWRVVAWDKDGIETSSQPALWEMGLLDPKEWQGKWIAGALAGGKFASVPCPYLRKPFELEQPVVSARLYITALGLYEAWINGERVGEDIFTPGWTDYHKRVAYQTYDVTALVKPGQNAFGAVLGDGWYSGHVAAEGRQNYGDRPRLLAQLEITLADGSRKTLVTDDTWHYGYGALLESDLLMGESYDARRELTGWSVAGYDESGWYPAVVMETPQAVVTAQVGPTVRRIEELHPVGAPVEFPGWPDSRWIFDLGQNMTGRVRLKVSGKTGQTVILRYAEVLKPDGNLYTENLRSARATDYYTLRGGSEEIYEPSFTFHGFRYVELSHYPGKPPKDAVTGIVIHSDMTPTGSFECSDPLINQLQHNIQWGQKGNFLDVPTDCPQRDERLGWTGDAQVFARTAAFNFDVAGFFNRWQQSLADSQGSAGNIPAVIPAAEIVPGDGGPAWADAVVICPWTIYQVYGDRRILETYYGSLQSYVYWLIKNSIGLIRCHPAWKGFPGFGDWLSINAETPRDLIGTAFFAYSARLLGQIASVLGKTNDAKRYDALFLEVREAFLQRFVTADGLISGQSQTAYILALHFDLLPEEMRRNAVDAIVADVRMRRMHLSAGFVGSSYMLPVLTQAGEMDMAYALLQQKTWPSWLYPVTRGATTIWERWDGWTDDKGFQDPGMNSFNHYAYGAVGAWLYQVVAGIEIDPQHPGYERILIHPRPGGGLTYAKADFESVRGRVSSHWEQTRKAFTLNVTVPVGSTALVYVPASGPEAVTEEGGMAGASYQGMDEGCAVYQVESGSYTFTSKPTKNKRS